jgi:disulfide bond formation protein DsbB
MTSVRRAAVAALLVAVGGAATILGAYFFQYVLKLPPCPLCLEQRIPYYVAIPLALVLAFAAAKAAPLALVRLGLVVLALVMLVGAGLGAYHAGIEWGLWKGPTECSGALPTLGSASDLMSQMQGAVVVRCDQAAWRFLGLSLAGYNVLISLALAAIALVGAAGGHRLTGHAQAA